MDFYSVVEILLAILVITVSIIYWIQIKADNYWKKRGLNPLKKNKSFFKSIFGFLSGIDFLKDDYKNCEGKYCGNFQFFRPTFLVCDPDLIMQILVKDFSHFEDRLPKPHTEDLINLGIGNLSTDVWRNGRHLLTPTFTSGKLKMMFDTLKKKSEELVDYLEGKTGEEIEAREMAMKYILNIVGDVAFGLNVDAFKENDKKNDFLFYSSKFFEPSFKQFIKVMISLFLPKISKMLKLKQLDDDVNDFFLKLTSDTINYRRKHNVSRNDFLQIMLDQKNKINGNIQNKTDIENTIYDAEDAELINNLKSLPMNNDKSHSEMFTEKFIAAQSFNFIAGGSENISAIISFILVEMALNQNYQEKVYQEIKKVLSNNELDYNAIKKLTYMEQFINETFRMHPVLIVMVRMCTRNYKIPGTESIIDKGTLVIIPIIELHRDPKYYPEPEKFNPDRFENMDDIPKGVFFSFGYGPRMCIALRFAMLEIKVFLAVLLSTYKVKLGKKTKLPLEPMNNSLVLSIKGGAWVEFEKRDI